MVCYYHSSCLELPVALVDFQVEGFPLCLHQICQGGYVPLNYIDFGRAERNIYCNYSDELRERGKSDILKKVEDSTVYGMEESEED